MTHSLTLTYIMYLRLLLYLGSTEYQIWLVTIVYLYRFLKYSVHILFYNIVIDGDCYITDSMCILPVSIFW